MSSQLVLPIFYKVKPSDVREQKGDFGKKFQLCKKKHKLDGESVQELENAFKEVANIKVWEVNDTENKYEGELVNKVVARIFNELGKAVLIVSDFLVGVEEHVKKIMEMIYDKPNDGKIIGIYGMGGIGKTTLAKVLYNALCSDFACRSFVPNIREASKTKGMEAVQNQIISDVLVGTPKEKISHVDEGINIIETRFKGKKLLLLLDDVEDKDQLDKLIANNSWVGSESIVIITTRNKDVTLAFAVNLSYELNELNMDQSYELFCKHAFKSNASCPMDLETLAKDIVSTTGGLPLAVEVIGSFLYQKDLDFWKEALKKLRRVPHEKVRDKLKISYDYLQRDQQEIFLDIACLSFREIFELEHASYYMWESCGFYPKQGIEKLISLSLIKRDDGHNAITIHDQLRDLGREIVHEEGRDNIGLCSRIWLQNKANEVMERKQGTHKVQALILPTFEELHYTSEDFEGMLNLRFLRMGDVHLTGDFKKLFLNLRWLCWESHPRRSCGDIMGIDFNPKKLVFLDLLENNVTEHWKGWSSTKDLKVIMLRRCMKLTTTPDFSAQKELKVLYLFFCQGLKNIHPSISKFNKTLEVFAAIDCRNLHELPIEFGEMEELRELDISFTPIREIPISKGYMTKLEKLIAGYCESLLHIPDSLGSLVKLQHLFLYMCKSVTKIPESIGKLRLLTELNLSGTGIEELPDSIGELCNLESLQMEETPIKCLPTSIGMLSKLRELNLERCKKLKSLPNLPPSSLTSLSFCGDSMETLLDLSNLTNLKSLKYTDLFATRNRGLKLGYLNQLETLWISGGDFKGIQKESKISYLVEELDLAPENFSLQLELPISLLKLEVSYCQTLRTLPNFSNFKNLSELSLKFCSEMMEINGLGGAESLTYLMIRGCKKLSLLGDVSYLMRLRNIELSDCEKLSDVQGIEKSTCLTSLIFSRCHPKIKFPDLSMLTNLKYLRIEDKELLEIPGLQELKSLEHLNISGCKSLQHLRDLSQCTKLKHLDVKGCEKLIEIRGLQELKSLKSLDISGYKSLQHFPNLSQCTKLEHLDVQGCERLTEIQGLQELKSLKSLDISGCKSLHHLSDLSQCTKLERLDVQGCERLTEIQGLQELKSLKSLDISGCKSLQHLPDLSQCTNLESLDIQGCERLTEIQLRGCSILSNLPVLPIAFRETGPLIEEEGTSDPLPLESKEEKKSLKSLDISGCKSLQHLPDLSQCTKLEHLDVQGYARLIKIQLRGCSILSNLPVLPIGFIETGPLMEEEGTSDPIPLENKEEKKSDSKLVDENEQICLATQKERKQVEREN